MVDNFLPGFEMQNQIDTAGEKDIEGQLDRIIDDISKRVTLLPKVGLKTKLQMSAIRKTLEKAVLADNADGNYIVNDQCTKCGICSKVCPAGNITVGEKVEFGGKCEVCYACIHNCPQNAIHLKAEKSNARFRNEHVKLADIISSNS